MSQCVCVCVCVCVARACVVWKFKATELYSKQLQYNTMDNRLEGLYHI